MKYEALRIKNRKNKSGGFTLVEVMISIGLFTVIMVIGIGAILGVNITNRKTQSMRAIIDNMSFVMEDMARSMRLGDFFVCIEDIEAPDALDVSAGGVQITDDGPDNSSGEPCNSISFEPYWNPLPTDLTNRVAYYIDSEAIWKKEPEMSFDDMLQNPITPAEIDIDPDRSGFIVTGSSKTDSRQPQITIVLVGTINQSGVSTNFNMQTTVSQRLLDVISIP